MYRVWQASDCTPRMGAQHRRWGKQGGQCCSKASPPFFFEADDSEESLVDFGGNANDPDAAHPSVSVHAASSVSEARLAAVAPAAAQLHDSDAVHQALLHQQGAPTTAQADSSNSALQPPCHMHRPLPLTMPAADSPLASAELSFSSAEEDRTDIVACPPRGAREQCPCYASAGRGGEHSC